MARKTLRDDDGNEYDVDLPDDDKKSDDDDDDDDTIYIDAEDIEWLKRKRLEESESNRKSATGTSSQKTDKGKVVRIRAKQDNTGGSAQRAASGQKSRKRVLKLA